MDNGTKAGTLGGTFLTIIVNIKGEDVLKTIVLAGIGAVVSFFVSITLQYLTKRKK